MGSPAPTVIDGPAVGEVAPPGTPPPPPERPTGEPPLPPDTVAGDPTTAREVDAPGPAETEVLEAPAIPGKHPDAPPSQQPEPPAPSPPSPSSPARPAEPPPSSPGSSSLWTTPPPPSSPPPPGPTPSPASPPPPPGAGGAAPGLRGVQAGDAAELARRVGAYLRRPGVAAALAGGVLAAAVTLAFGLVLAIAFPDDDSIIGVLGIDASTVTETFRQAASFLQVSFDAVPIPGAADESLETHGRITPLLLLAIPLGACALGGAAVLPRTHGMATSARLASCAGLAFTFALLMLICALASGEADPSAGGTFFLALLWGGLGALLGTVLSLRRKGEPPLGLPVGSSRIPPALRPLGPAVAASLRPLGALLLVMGALGAGAWVTHVLIDDDGENRARTAVEVALFAADHAVHFAELGALVSFEENAFENSEGSEEIGLPAPSNDPEGVSDGDGYRIFAYRDGLATYLFVPGVILLIALPLLLALYAGFATSRAAGPASSTLVAAAWGALVGPVWAIAMAILDALASKGLNFEALGESAELSFFGSARGASTFGLFLLIGAVLGGLGGLLAGSGGTAGQEPGGRAAGVGAPEREWPDR